MPSNIHRIIVLALLAALLLAVGCQGDDDDDDDDFSPDDDDDNDDDDDDQRPEGEFSIYDIQGSDSIHGDYTGLVEIRAADTGPNFIRLIRYDGLAFPDPRLDKSYDVHAAWLGGVDLTTGEIAVELQVADYLVRYGQNERTEDDADPVLIQGNITGDLKDGIRVSYSSDPDSNRSFQADETWTYSRQSTDDPIFVLEDEYVISHEPAPENLRTIIWALLTDYHALEFFDDYRHRAEFKAGLHKFPHFRTDADWYRENPEALRIVNKWPDTIAMAETMMRARAFSPTLAQKAAAFDEEMPELYINELGMVCETFLDSEPPDLKELYDGMLWTGCYLAGQAFRYLETGEPEALDNWLLSLDGVILSHDIVQDPTTFARTVRPHEQDGSKDWYHADPPYEDYDWRCCANNDMYEGLLYAYTISWIFLPDDPQYDAYRDAIALRAKRLADHCEVANDGGLNEVRACLLAYLATGEQTYFDRYNETFNQAYRLWTAAGNGMFYLWGISDWSGQHLNTVSTLSFWFLANEAGLADLDLINEGLINGMRTNATTRQVLWPVAAYSFTDPPADTDPVFQEAIWSMREFPYPKQRFDIDHRIDPSWCASPLPCLPWKFDWMDGGRHQGLYAPPLFASGVSTNFFVKWPFSFAETESDLADGGGPDYLHAYWMGRYYGAIDPNE